VLAILAATVKVVAAIVKVVEVIVKVVEAIVKVAAPNLQVLALEKLVQVDTVLLLHTVQALVLLIVQALELLTVQALEQHTAQEQRKVQEQLTVQLQLKALEQQELLVIPQLEEVQQALGALQVLEVPLPLVKQLEKFQLHPQPALMIQLDLQEMMIQLDLVEVIQVDLVVQVDQVVQVEVIQADQVDQVVMTVEVLVVTMEAMMVEVQENLFNKMKSFLIKQFMTNPLHMSGSQSALLDLSLYLHSLLLVLYTSTEDIRKEITNCYMKHCQPMLEINYVISDYRSCKVSWLKMNLKFNLKVTDFNTLFLNNTFVKYETI